VRLLVRDATTPIDGEVPFGQSSTGPSPCVERLNLPSPETTGYRLVYAEGDGLPGLVVDRFGDTLCVQFLTFGMKAREHMVLDALSEKLAPRRFWIGPRRRPPAPRASRLRAVSYARRRRRPGLQGARPRIPQSPRCRSKEQASSSTKGRFEERSEQLSRGKARPRRLSSWAPSPWRRHRGGAAEIVAVDESAVALEDGGGMCRLNGLGDSNRVVKQDARKFLSEARAQSDLVIVDLLELAPSRVLATPRSFSTRSSAEAALGPRRRGVTRSCARARRP